MLSKNIRKVFLGIIAGFLMVTSIPLSALADETNNVELSLVSDDPIYVGDEFEIEIKNEDTINETILVVPSGIIYKEELNFVDVKDNILSIKSGEVRKINMSADSSGTFDFYFKKSGIESQEKFSVNVYEKEENSEGTEENLPKEENNQKLDETYKEINGKIETPTLYSKEINLTDENLSVKIGNVNEEGTISEDVFIPVTVKANITGSESDRIKITIPSTMKFNKYPHVSPSQSYEDPMPSDIATHVISITRPDYNSKIGGPNGELTYVFNRATAGIVELDFTISANNYVGYESVTELMTLINVQLIKSNGSIENRVSLDSKIDRGKVNPVFNDTWNTTRTTEAVLGQKDNHAYGGRYFAYANAAGGARSTYVKEIELTIKYPAHAKYVDQIRPSSWSGGPWVKTSHKDSKVDGEMGEVKFISTDVRDGSYGYDAGYLAINLDVSDLPATNHVVPNSYSVKVVQNDNQVKIYNDTASHTIIIKDPKDALPQLGSNFSGRYFSNLGDGTTSRLNTMRFLNDGLLNKKNQHFEFDFDENLEVNAFRILRPILGGVGQKLENIEFRISGTTEWKTFIDPGYGGGIFFVDKKELGLLENQFISGIKFVMPEVDYNYGRGESAGSVENSIVGRLKEGASEGISTVKVYNTDDDGNIIQSSYYEKTAKTTLKEKNYIIQAAADADNTSGIAGNNIPVTLKMGYPLQASEMYAFRNPVFYYRIPDGATVDLSSVKVELGSQHDNFEATIIKDNQNKNVLRVETKNLNSGITVVSGPQYIGYKATTVKFNMSFPKSAQTQFISHADRVFVELKNDALSSYKGPDKYNLMQRGTTSDLINIINPSTTAGISLTRSNEIALDSYLVPEGMGPQPEYDPTDETSAVGFTTNTKGNYTLKFANNRTSALDQMVLFVPIPKEGDNFGSKIQIKEFPFSLSKLSGMEVKVYDQDGKIIPGRDLDFIDEYTSIATEANFDEMPGSSGGSIYSPIEDNMSNMMRIKTTKPIQPGELVEIVIQFEVDEDPNDLTEEKLTSVLDFMTYYDIDNAKFNGTRVGINLSLGQISGILFNDVNYNGIYESGEELSDVDISISKIGDPSFVRPPFKTNVKGEFKFEELLSGDYVLDFNNAISSGNYEFTINKSEDPKGNMTTPIGVNKGKIYIKPTDTKSEEIYVGVVDYPSNGFESHTSMEHSTVKLIEPNPSNVPHAQTVKKNALKFNPATVKNFVDGDISARSNDTSIATVKVLNNEEVEVTAVRTEVVGDDRETTVTVSFKDIYGGTNETTFKVEVRANDKPIITLKKDYITVPVGTPFTMALDTEVELSDPQEGNLDHTKITPSGHENIHNQTGVNFVDYNFKDTDNNPADTVTRTVIYVDENSKVENGHLIEYKPNYSIDMKDYPTNDTAKRLEAETKGGVKVTKIADGSNVDVTYDFTNYKKAYGDQTYTFEFVGKSGTTITKTITVTIADNAVDAGEYTYYANNTFIGKEAAAKIVADDNFKTKSVELTGAVAKPKDGTADKPLKFKGVDNAFDGTPGKYTVTFELEGDTTGKEIKAVIEVLDFDDVVQDGEFVIAANNFKIGKNDIETNNYKFVDRAKAKAYQYDGENLNPIEVHSTTTTLDKDVTTPQPVSFKTSVLGAPANFGITVNATVEGGKVVEGDTYVLVVDEKITVEPYIAEKYLTDGYTNSNDIITKANAKAYLKTDLTTPVANKVIFSASTFAKDTDGTATFVVDGDPKATETILVEINKDTEAPELIIEASHKDVIVPINGTVPYEAGVTGRDKSTNENLSFVTTENTKGIYVERDIDTSVVGVHTLVYTATDANGKKTTNFKIIRVTNGTLPEIGEYYIVSNNIMDKVSEYQGKNDAQINQKLIDDSGAYAVSKLTGDRKTVYVSDRNDFKVEAGNYVVKLKVTGQDAALTTTANLRVVLTNGDIEEGENFYITAIDKTVTNKRGREIVANTDNTELFNDMKVFAVHKTEDIPVTKDMITVTGRPSEIKKELKPYPMKFTVSNDANISKTLTVLKEDEGTNEGKLWIVAEPFIIGRDSIDGADLVKYAGARAWNTDTPTVPLGVEVTPGKGLDKNGADTQYVTFNIVGLDQSITVEVTVIDGNTILTDKYILAGDDFTINGKEALAIKNNDANSDDILLAHTTAYDRNTLEVVNNVVEVNDKSLINNVAGTYAVKFNIVGDTNAANILPLDVTVNMGTAPVLTANKYTELPVGTEYTHDMANIGGTATNNTKTNIELTDLDLTLVDGIVNKDKVGVYKLTYYFTDDYGIETDVTHLVVVNDGSIAITTEYIIYAENIILSLDQVRTNAEVNIKTESKPKAWVIETGEEVASTDLYANRGNLQAVENETYEAYIRVNDDEDHQKAIQVHVAEDYIEGDDYFIITGKDTKIGKNTAQAILDAQDNQLILDIMSVKAMHKTSLDPVLPSAIKVENNITTTDPQSKPVKFTVIADPKAHTEKELTVLEDDEVDRDGDIYLSANGFVVGRNSIKDLNANHDLYVDYAKAKAWNDKTNADLKNDIVVLETLDADPTKPTIQNVVFGVKNSDAKVTVQVRILDGDTEVGEDYILSGNSFTINRKQVLEILANEPGSDKHLLDNQIANLELYLKGSTTLATDAKIVVLDSSALQETETPAGQKGYPVVFGVLKNGETTPLNTPKLTLNVKVTNGVLPTLNIQPTSRIKVGEETFNPEAQFISGTAENDTPNALSYAEHFAGNTDPVYGGHVTGVDDIDVNKVGVYEVIYSYRDSIDNYIPKSHLVIVTDGSIQETNDHIIYGENVVLHVDDVDANVADKIKNQSNAYAYVIETGELLDDDLITIDASQVKAKEGIYTASIIADNDPTTKEIKVLVTAGDIVEGDNHFIVADDAVVSLAEVKQPLDQFNKTLIERARAKAVHKTMDTDVEVKVNHSIDENTTTTTAEYYVEGDAGAKITKNVKVVKDEVVVNDGKTYLSANHIIVAKKDVAAINSNPESLIGLSKAKAWNDKDTSNIYVPYVLDGTIDENDDQVQIVKLGVRRTTTNLDEPVAEVQVLVVDGEVAKGDTHTLTGKNFTLTGSEVVSILADTDGSSTDQLLLGEDYGNVKSYLTGTTEENGTPVVFEKTRLQVVDGGKYLVDFKVKVDDVVLDEPLLQLEVTVAVADEPTLDVTPNSEMAPSDSFDAEDYYNGGKDYTENPVKDIPFEDVNVDLRKLEEAKRVDGTYTPGVYTITYSYTDSSDQTVSEPHTISVNDGSIIEEWDYFIYAENAALNLDDVKGKTESQINDLVRPQVKPVVTNKFTGKVLEDEKVTLTGFNKVVSDQKVGTYPITVQIEGVNTSKKVKLEITNGDIDEIEDYIFITNDTTVTVKEVSEPNLDKVIIKRSGTKAIHKTTGVNAPISVDTSVIGTTIDQSYPVEYKAAGVSQSKTANVKVIKDKYIGEDGDVYIKANSFVIGKDQVAGFNSDATFDLYINAAGAKAWSDDVETPAGGFVIKVNSAKRLTNQVGSQTVEYFVEGYPDAKVLVDVEVTDGHVVVGDTYTISAKNIIISAAEAQEILDEPQDMNNPIFTHANVKVFKNGELDPVTTGINVSFDKDTLEAIGGDYKSNFSVDGDSKAVVEIDVKVTQGLTPEFTVGPKQVVNINNLAAYDWKFETKLVDKNGGGELSLVLRQDDEDLLYGGDTHVDFGGLTVDENGVLLAAEEGPYVVTYNTIDNNKNPATGYQVVVVEHTPTPVVDDYIIYAENVVLDFNTEVDGKDDAQILESINRKTKGYAINQTNFRRSTVSVKDLGSEFTRDAGSYKMMITVDGVTPTVETPIYVTVTRGHVVKGEQYTLTYTDAYTTVDEYKLVAPAGREAFIINKANAQATPKRGLVMGTVKFDETVPVTKGETDINFYVVEDTKGDAKGAAKVFVKDSDQIVEVGDYVITANDFPIGILDIPKFSLDKYNALANAEVEHKMTKVVTKPTSVVRPQATVGKQDTTFKSNLADDLEITVKADVFKGNVVVKDEHYIVAEPVSTDVETVVTIIDEFDNNLETTFKGLSNVKAYKLEDDSEVDVVLVSSNLEAKASGNTDYKVVYEVKDHSDVAIEIPVTVSKGLDPVITAPDYIEIKLNDPFVAESYATAKDMNKNTDIPMTAANATHNVNNQKAGFYTVTYTVTDSNLNTVTSKPITVFVNDGSFEVIGDYVVSAKNFVINKDLVTPYDVAGQIKAKSEVKAVNWKTNKAVLAHEITVKDDKGYSKNVKVYKDIELQIVDAANIKKITAEVTDSNVVEGQLYSITSKSTFVGQLDAKLIAADSSKLLTAMDVKVTKRVNDPSVPEGTVQIDNWSEFSVTPDTYEMKFSVVEETSTKTKDKIQVMDRDIVIIDGAYMIAANRFYVGKDNYNKLVPSQLVELADAYATRTINNNTSKIPVHVVDYPNKGTSVITIGPDQEVIFAVNENSDTKITTYMTVLEGTITQTDNYYIQTQGTSTAITVLKELQKNNPAYDIFNIMRVRVFERGTNAPVNGMAQLGTDLSALTTDQEELELINSTHNIEFYIEENGEKAVSTSPLVLLPGTPPEITIPKVQVVDLDTPIYNKMDGLVMSDIEDDLNPDAPALVATLAGDTDVEDAIASKTAGVFTVTYSTTDYDGNTSFAYQTVVLDDGSFVVGADYVLEAKGFSINTKDVVVDETQLRSKTEAKAYKLGENHKLVDITVVSPTYSKNPGEYPIQITVVDEPTTTKEVFAKVTKDNVTNGDVYDISAAKVYIGKDEAQAVVADNTKLIDLALAKATNKRTGDDATVEVVSTTVAVNPGTYTVIFKVVDEEDTTIEVPVIVLDSKYVVINKEHVLAADDFYVGLDDITNGMNSEDYVERAKAYAFDRYDDTVQFDVSMDMTTEPSTAGAHQVSLSVDQNASATLDVTANVLDGNVVQGDDYYIKAENKTIYVSQADKMLKGELSLIDLAEAFAADYDDVEADVEVKEHNIEAEHGEYYAIFKVVGSQKPEVKVTINVDKGVKPTLTLPAYTEIPLGGTFDEMAGVSVNDDRDDLVELLAKVEISEGSVNTNKVGRYELEYSVTDTDFNTTTEKTVVVVNDGSIVIQDGYILEANNFLINKDDVTGTNNELITEAKASAYKINTHEEVDVIVLESNGYSPVKGEYTIKFAVSEKQTITRTITAEVVSGDVIEGDEYYLSANDITIGKEDVATLDHNDIMARAEAKAIHKTLGTSGTVVIDSLNLSATPNDYPVTYKVVEDGTVLVKNIKVLAEDIVIEDDEYVITANNFFVGDKFVLEMTKEDLVNLAGARAYKKSNPDVSIPVTQVEDIVTSIGTHKVTFAVVEKPSMTVQVTKTIFRDTIYFIEANDSEIKISDLTKASNTGMLEATILDITQAKGYKINEDGSKESMQVYIGNKEAMATASAGTSVDIRLTLVDPNASHNPNSRAMNTSHRIADADTTVKILVHNDKDGSGKGKGGVSTGIETLPVTFLAMLMTFAALVLTLLLKKRRNA